jgi:protein ImuA
MIPEKAFQIAQLRAKIGRIGTDSATPRLARPRAGLSLLTEGLPAGCIHEIEGASWDAETGVAASGFAAAMLSHVTKGSILWAVRQDAPFAPRLASFGLHPDRVIYCRCRNDAEMLAVLEDALRTNGIAAAIGEVEHATLTQSRRLHLICETAGNMALLMRRRFHGVRAARKAEGSAAATRWRIASAPSDGVGEELGPPRWRLDLLYRRGGTPASYVVEWNERNVSCIRWPQCWNEWPRPVQSDASEAPLWLSGRGSIAYDRQRPCVTCPTVRYGDCFSSGEC